MKHQKLPKVKSRRLQNTKHCIIEALENRKQNIIEKGKIKLGFPQSKKIRNGIRNEDIELHCKQVKARRKREPFCK